MCRWGAVIIYRCADIVPPREMVILAAVLAIGCVEAQLRDPLYLSEAMQGKVALIIAERANTCVRATTPRLCAGGLRRLSSAVPV